MQSRGRTSFLTATWRALAVCLAVALLATSCRVETTTNDSATPSLGVDVAEPTQAPDPTATAVPEATATAVPEPTATQAPEPRPTATPDPAGEVALPLDPDVITGELDNGLRYFVRRNTRPGSQAQLRLTVDVGSLQETDEIAGIAHFLEHMLFNGTTRFPGNQLFPVLESFGSAFGADVNAYTSFQETVYSLEMSARNVETVQLGLDVLREWAGEALLEEIEVVAERGVVREEFRIRTQSAASRIGDLLIEGLLVDSAFEGRLPIGTVPVIEGMQADDVREFYDTWYRPERMAVIAVGDFDPNDIERRIIEAFRDLEARAPAADLDLDYGGGSLPEPVFNVLLDDEIGRPDLEMVWRFDHDPVATENSLRDALLGEITRDLLNDRFFELVQASESPLIEHTVEIGAFTSNFEILSVAASAEPDDMSAVVDEVMTELERVRQHGFDDIEFERTVEKYRGLIEQEYTERATVQDRDLASGLVDYALGRGVLLSSDDKFAAYNAALDSLIASDSQRLIDEIISGNPFVLLTGPTRLENVLPEPEDLSAAYDEANGRPVAPRGQSQAIPTQLMARPEPARVIETEEIEAIGATVVTFDNGARLGYRKTNIVDNFLEFSAVSQGGFFATDGPETPLLGQISGSILQSGFASIDAVTLGRFLSDSSVSLSGAVGRSYERLGGSASTNDLETFMQLVHLQMTEPTLEAAQVRQFEQSYRPLATNPATRPNLAASLEMWTQRYGNSPWYRLIPTVDDLDSLDPDLLLNAWADRFSNAGDFLFLFAGDFDEEELIDLGARYLGTLPATEARETVTPRDPGIPQENVVSTVEAGFSNQGVITWNWESAYPYTIEGRVVADLLMIVVNARLRDRLREELGASYSPSVSTTVLSQPEPWIDTILQVAADPERVEELSEVVAEELDLIRTGQIDSGYVDRAIEQQVEDYRFYRNGTWLDELEIQLFHPDRADDEIWERDTIARQVTFEDIVAAAAVVFPEDRSIEVRLVPAGG